MTPEERNKAIADLVVRYSDNLKTIAALRSRLRGIGAHLQDIGAGLLHSLDAMDVAGNGAIVHTGYSDGHNLQDVDIDGESLRATLREYRGALATDADMVTDLEQAGLSNIVKREQPPRRA